MVSFFLVGLLLVSSALHWSCRGTKVMIVHSLGLDESFLVSSCFSIPFPTKFSVDMYGSYLRNF